MCRTVPDAQLEPHQRTGTPPHGWTRTRLNHGEDTNCHECGCPLDSGDHALTHAAGDLTCGRGCAQALNRYWKAEAARVRKASADMERRIEWADLQGGF